MLFADRLKTLPRVAHIQSIHITDQRGQTLGDIENKPGQAGSVALYHYLAETFDCLGPEAAQKGLELYSEHTDDARQHPGKHPNIDRLFDILEHQYLFQITCQPYPK